MGRGTEIDVTRLGRGLARQAMAMVQSNARPAVIRRLGRLAAEMETLLRPRASVRMVPAEMVDRDSLRLGDGVRRWTRASSCRECRFFERCRKPLEKRRDCR